MPGRELEARELACFCLGIDKNTLLLQREREFEVMRDPQDVIARRLAGEPLAYIIGQWDFYGRTFIVLPGVLVPRTDSEFVFERALNEYLCGVCGDYTIFKRGEMRIFGDFSGVFEDKADISYKKTAKKGNKISTIRALDLCCGSGVLGISLALELQKRGLDCEVVLGDISERALECARENFLRHGLKGAKVMKLDALEPAGDELGKFDVVLCNPPYVRSGEIEGLEPTVRDYEPRLALDGGGDGLRFYRAVAAGYAGALAEGGLLAFEVGAGQGAAAAEIMERAGFENVRFERDYEGNDRVVMGRKIYEGTL